MEQSVDRLVSVERASVPSFRLFGREVTSRPEPSFATARKSCPHPRSFAIATVVATPASPTSFATNSSGNTAVGGSIWILICLRPFQFADEYVIGSEPVSDGGTHATSAVLKTPPQSSLMEYLIQVCRGKNPDTLGWGETGPKLVADGLSRLSLGRYVQASSVFCPVGWYDWDQVLDPTASVYLGFAGPCDSSVERNVAASWQRHGRCVSPRLPL